VSLPHPSDVIVIDYEASSLKGTSNGVVGGDADSFPIEVGLAYPDGRVESYYISPVRIWTDWDTHVEENIHKISRDMLIEQGRDVNEIANILNNKLSGKTVVCDGKFSDPFWTNRLFSAANVECQFSLFYLYDLIDQNDPLFDIAYEQVEVSDETPHRAGEDAVIIKRFYQSFYELKNAPKSKKNELRL
jgi:hypothetical protein